MEGLTSVKLNLFKPKDADIAQREGIKIDKGAILTSQYLEKIEGLLRKYISFFTAYPDLFLDLIKPQESEFKLFFYQRIVLRAVMRFKEVNVTACRAFSKSFISILGIFLQCIFMPGTKRFICAPAKNQSAQIAKEKIMEIYEKWPLLKQEIEANNSKDTPGNFGKDYVTLRFKNGSQFDVVGALDSARGGRRHGFKKFFSLHLKNVLIKNKTLLIINRIKEVNYGRLYLSN